jgi:hypothetical protein
MEGIKFKLMQQKECRRKSFWCVSIWLFISIHRTANLVRVLSVDPKFSEHLDFFIGTDLILMVFALALFNTNLIVFNVISLCYLVVHGAHVYMFFNSIFLIYLSVVLFIVPISVLISYHRVSWMKMGHLQAIKISQLLKEQQMMFENLPDGAIIHRAGFSEEAQGDQV